MKINTNTKVGIFVVITLALTIWGINFLKGIDLFKKEQTFYIIYEKLEGLSVTNPVNLRGMKVGQVNEVYFTDNTFETVTIKISVDKSIKIPKGTVAKIQSSDFLGTKEIAIELGTSILNLSSGDTLIPMIETGIQEAIRLEMVPVKRKAISLMSSMDSVMAVMQSVFDENTKINFRKSISSIKTTFQNLERSTESIDAIVSRDGNLRNTLKNIEEISNNINQNNDKINNILSNISTISDSLAQSDLKTTLLELKSSITELSEISRKINNNEGTLGALVNDDSMHKNLNKLSNNLDSLIKNPHIYHHLIFGKKEKKNK